MYVTEYPHIEVNISCTRGFVKDVLVTECADKGRRCYLYTHILLFLLPTILDNALSTLNKIVPSDKSCRSVKFYSRAPSAQELMAFLQE